MGEWFSLRNSLVALAFVGLFLVYIFQRIDYLGLLSGWVGVDPPTATTSFIVNRSIRMIVNDLLCISLVHQFFRNPAFSRLAWWVFLGELLVLLPLYLALKLTAEGPSEISSPIYQPLHRMIVNPLLMLTLIAGMYFQKKATSK